jgi:hypothetical protein
LYGLINRSLHHTWMHPGRICIHSEDDTKGL